MTNETVFRALNSLAACLFRYYGKKAIILLDEYDTPMQEAYINGYLEEFTGFMRSMFNATFKTNPYMERAVMTGITRVSKESLFLKKAVMLLICSIHSGYNSISCIYIIIRLNSCKADKYYRILTL